MELYYIYTGVYYISSERESRHDLRACRACQQGITAGVLGGGNKPQKKKKDKSSVCFFFRRAIPE